MLGGVHHNMLSIKFVALVVGILLMVPETMQLHANNPLYSSVERVNDMVDKNSIVGLILTSQYDEKQLLSSGYFVPNATTPLKFIGGRRYHIGRFNNIRTVYVLGGEPMAGVSVTVQLLVDNFRVGAIISTGSAASLGGALNIADVAVVHSTAYTSVWRWQPWEGASVLEGSNVTLTFGDYNLPKPGDNQLGSIDYQPVRRYTPLGSSKKVFWFPIPLIFKRISAKLKGIELEKCFEETSCADEQPTIVHGVKGGSSDVFLLNRAYGNFLKEKFGVSLVDRQSAAIASTAYTNGLPYAVFRGVTNRLGKPSDKKMVALASKNSLKVAAIFTELIADKLFPVYNYYQA